MTDFFAAYLLLILAVVFLIVALYFKHFWIFLLSGFSWIISGIYFLVNSTGQNTTIFVLGIFCILVSLPTFLAIWWTREKAEPESPEEQETAEDQYRSRIDKRIERRNKRRRYGKSGIL
jgi:membrane-bound ClpP family serine protease